MKLFWLFVILQAADAITTVLGLRMGASEVNPLVRQMGLPGVKLLALLLAGVLLYTGRVRCLRLPCIWFGGIVAWNLFVIGRLYFAA